MFNQSCGENIDAIFLSIFVIGAAVAVAGALFDASTANMLTSDSGTVVSMTLAAYECGKS